MVWKVFGRTVANTAVLIAILATIVAAGLDAAWAGPAATKDAAQGVQAQEPTGQAGTSDAKFKAYEAIATLLTAGLTVSCACIAAGVAVGKIGSAAMGAAAEKPEIMGRALLFVVVAEGIAIYGLVVGILLVLRL